MHSRTAVVRLGYGERLVTPSPMLVRCGDVEMPELRRGALHEQAQRISLPEVRIRCRLPMVQETPGAQCVGLGVDLLRGMPCRCLPSPGC
jgi:hypothetical protein